MRALRLDPSGQLAVITLDSSDTLRSKQAAVGGYIEHLVAVPGEAEGDEISLYGNDEARLVGMPFNAFVELELGTPPMDVVGPILICGADEMGDTRGLTDGEIAAVRVLTKGGIRVVQLPGMAPSLPALR
ncbi:MAG: DUF3846 domain-containing protein [Gemmatimonadaceae bacterium]|nr:DUF3846 domain-containing protein [Gemmatimonadaceae bacterium]